jgi:hypothetical protein
MFSFFLVCGNSRRAEREPDLAGAFTRARLPARRPFAAITAIVRRDGRSRSFSHLAAIARFYSRIYFVSFRFVFAVPFRLHSCHVRLPYTPSRIIRLSIR